MPSNALRIRSVQISSLEAVFTKNFLGWPLHRSSSVVEVPLWNPVGNLGDSPEKDSLWFTWNCYSVKCIQWMVFTRKFWVKTLPRLFRKAFNQETLSKKRFYEASNKRLESTMCHNVKSRLMYPHSLGIEASNAALKFLLGSSILAIASWRFNLLIGSNKSPDSTMLSQQSKEDV